MKKFLAVVILFSFSCFLSSMFMEFICSLMTYKGSLLTPYGELDFYSSQISYGQL